LRKMRDDEPPVFLKKDDRRLDLAYPEGKETRIVTLGASNRVDAEGAPSVTPAQE